MQYQINYVDSFSDSFTQMDDGCDSHGLNSGAVLTLRDEMSLIEADEFVAVRGEHPWEYRHFTNVNKSSLEKKKEKLREALEEEKAEGRIEEWYTVEAIAQQVAKTVLNDSNATPHKMSIEDYDVRIEILETDKDYTIMLAWEPA